MAFALDLHVGLTLRATLAQPTATTFLEVDIYIRGDIRPATMKAVVDLGQMVPCFQNLTPWFSISSWVPFHKTWACPHPITDINMMAMARAHDIEVAPMCHRTDHEQLVQKIINSAPKASWARPLCSQTTTTRCCAV